MEENNKRRVARRIQLGSILVLLFLLLYVPSLIFWVYGKNINTDIIRMGEIEDSINVDAFIIRNETVLNSPMDGKCIKEVGEGEKIQAYSRVATILNKSSEKLLDDMKALDLRIIDVQKQKSSNEDFFSDDVKKIDKEIEEKLKVVIDQGNDNSLLKIRKIKDEIDGLIRKKASIIGELSSSDVHLSSLLKEKRALEGKIKENTRDIISKSSGIISYMVDGYENILDPEKIGDLTPNDLDKIKIKEKARDVDDLSVELDRPFAKVIREIYYDIVFVLDKRSEADFRVDDHISIRINDIDKVIDGIIAYKSKEIDGKYVVSVRVDKAMSETAGLRKINIDLIKSYYSGLRVPLKSLRNIDTLNMKAELALVRANRARYTPVKIIGKNNEFAIIDNMEISFKSGVSLYTSYIINPKNIEEGQIID
ncbi:MAG: HlyD family efflux transporter periplasmic adaptor subunit [Bacillota bacterium]